MRAILLFLFIGIANLTFCQVLQEKVLDELGICSSSSKYLSSHPFNDEIFIVVMNTDCNAYPEVSSQFALINSDFDTLYRGGAAFNEFWFSDFGTISGTDSSFYMVLSQSTSVHASPDSLYIARLSLDNGLTSHTAFSLTNCFYEESDYFSGPDENIVVVNYKQGNCNNYKDASITSLDYNYNTKWTYKYEGVKNDEIYSIKKLNDNSLLALGHSNSKSSLMNLFLLHLDSLGNFKSSFGFPDSVDQSYSLDMEVDSSGNIYMAWHKNNQLLITKLSEDLKEVWELPLYTYGLSDIEFQFSEIDNSLIIISNGINPFTSDFEQLVHKIDVRGNVVWKRKFDERIADFIIKKNGSLIFYGDDLASDFTQIIHFDSTFAEYPPIDSSFVPNSDTSTTVGINDMFGESNSVEIFPNPFTDFTNIRSSKMRISNYSIYNLMGQIVDRKEVGRTEEQVRFNDFTPGTYILQIELEDGSINTRKIIYRK